MLPSLHCSNEAVIIPLLKTAAETGVPEIERSAASAK
jgi:hypothetical protein